MDENRKNYALAVALDALNVIAAVEGFDDDRCDRDDTFCCDLCAEMGCLDYKRNILRDALHPHKLEDFGFEDIDRSDLPQPPTIGDGREVL